MERVRWVFIRIQIPAMLISVIVTTYNRPAALALVLASLQRQGDRHFEVWVADDGSRKDTRTLVAQWQARWQVEGQPPLHHVWQPDLGFRAARARNLATLLARGDYLIFLDGDCIVQPDFVARHRALTRPGTLVTGSRILLSARITACWEAAGSVPWLHFLRWAWLARLRGNINKCLPLYARWPAGLGRNYRTFVWRRIKSCNLAVWKSDALRVNGFDESFVGWGHEDADFVLRLHHANIRRRGGAWATEVLHLWHPEAPRAQEDINRARVEERIRYPVIRAAQGLDILQQMQAVGQQDWTVYE